MCSVNRFNPMGILILAAAGTLSASDRPNIVFVIADDCTFRDIGCYGGQAHTPNIDRLATEGIRMTRCFQAAPMCSPTRHNIYTGLYPVKSGAYPNHTFAKPGTKSIAHYLKPLGYRVALSGKTHIGPREVFPFEYSSKGNNPDMDAVDQLFAECKQTDTPLCLFACSNEPHSPWNKGDASRYPAEKLRLPPYMGDTPVMREAFRRYLAEITYYDGQVGQILDLLSKHGLADNTLVMVVSEQGNSFPFAKWTCYGNGLQSAMIVRWPDHIQPGTESSAMVEYTDITPTFVEAAGGTPDRSLDGRSMLKVLTGQSDQHKQYAFGEMTTRGIINGSDAFAIRTVRGTRFRLIWNLHHQTEFTNACTKADYFQSLVQAAAAGDEKAAAIVDRYQHRAEYELFDCDADPLEMTNVVDDPDNADVLAELKAELAQWMQRQGDQGHQTELDAILHLSKFKNMTREQAYEAWSGKQIPDNKKTRGKKKKEP